MLGDWDLGELTFDYSFTHPWNIFIYSRMEINSSEYLYLLLDWNPEKYLTKVLKINKK